MNIIASSTSDQLRNLNPRSLL